VAKINRKRRRAEKERRDRGTKAFLLMADAALLNKKYKDKGK
jgi:hypothetical protein